MLDFKPILVGGVARSGTNLVRNLLGSHSDIAMPEYEYQFFSRFYTGGAITSDSEFNDILQKIVQHPRIADWGISSNNLAESSGNLERSWRSLFAFPIDQYRKTHDKAIGGDKTPGYEFRYALLRDWFADDGLQFVHMIRNPVDTYSSHVDLFGPTNPVRWCLMWNASVSLALRYSSEYSDDYVVVKYEELTQETERIMSGLCNDLAITPEIENMVNLAGYSNVDNSSFKAQFGESKYMGNVRTSDNFDRSSKISADERLLVRELCGPLASVIGYDFQTCFEFSNLQDKELRIGSPGIYLSKLIMKQFIGMMPKIAKKKVFGNPRTRGWYR